MIRKIYLTLLNIVIFANCSGQISMDMTHQYTNELINETSPYLLQHAHNPVDWKAWNDNTLKEAKDNQKLILISVGYAACHWCHVMERESFEDSLVAQVMNENFVNIKVDREERPDVDQVYMNAVNLMTGRGGWPLNVVALPDGRPFWGGTYFQKDQWLSALNQIVKVYKNDPEKLVGYANKLEEGIKSIDLVNLNSEKVEFNDALLNGFINVWSQNFDNQKGGNAGAPKFMMPNNVHTLLRQAYQNNDEELQEYVNLTLTKMAYGGIYDHIGGGFARYSVDDKWHVPHFEKMLYDNAQLVSLYSDAYLITKNQLYRDIVYETLNFVERELTDEIGTFYSSLDADSNDSSGELEEGAFYVWKEDELKTLLQDDFNLFADYYNINDYGFWEYDNFVLIRNTSDLDFINQHGINNKVLIEKKKSWKNTLLTEREKRDRPRLDDKVLTSWNALMLRGYADAYRVFGEPSFLESALKNGNFILSKQLKDDGGLYHNFKAGKSTINGYLEDYAAVIDAFLTLYENTLDEKWLNASRDFANYCFDHFYNDTNSMFYFTSDEDSSLVTRSTEYRDNVIPASNSIMAKNLFKLSHYFDNASFAKTALTMLNNVLPELKQYPSSFSNWIDLMLNHTDNYYEVAIVGKNAKEKIQEINQTYLPNKLLIGSTSDNNLPLLKNRYIEDETLIYVCVNKACKLPVSEVDRAITFIKE